MKKVFTLIAASAVTLAAMATDYTGKITVTVNENPNTQETTISVVQNEDSTYKLSINNFMLVSPETTIPVGNIVLDEMIGYTVNGVTTVVANQTIYIQPGNLEGLTDNDWMGPLLGPVPIIMAAQFDDTNAKVDIDIDMQSLMGQFINVKFYTREEGSGIYGDVNGDEVVNAADVTCVYNVILGNSQQQ